MPTLILVDTSLSMLRLASQDDSGTQRKLLAEEGIRQLLQHLKSSFPLEFSALMAFSSDCDLVVDWTRDYDMLTAGLISLGIGDKTNFVGALRKAGECCQAEWGVAAPCQIIVVSDERPFLLSAQESIVSSPEIGRYRFSFPCKLHFLVLTSSDDVKPDDVTNGTELGNHFCELFGSSYVHMPIGSLNSCSVGEMFQKLIECHYVPFIGDLQCGGLKSKITLVPPPMRMRQGGWTDQQHPGNLLESKIDKSDFPKVIQICGFMHLADLAGVPVLSRHVVLDDPSLAQRLSEHGKLDDKPSVAGIKLESTGGRKASVAGNVGGTGGLGIRLEKPDSSGLMGSERADYGKTPSFRILLHGSLKVEGMAALAKIG